MRILSRCRLQSANQKQNALLISCVVRAISTTYMSPMTCHGQLSLTETISNRKWYQTRLLTPSHNYVRLFIERCYPLVKCSKNYEDVVVTTCSLNSMIDIVVLSRKRTNIRSHAVHRWTAINKHTIVWSRWYGSVTINPRRLHKRELLRPENDHKTVKRQASKLRLWGR